MKTKKYILFFIGGILLASLLYLAGSRIPSTQGSAPSGLPAGYATTSLWAVSGTVGTVFATSTSCAARTITASTTNIHISFSQINNFQPSPTQGHLQLASTTITYDSGLYGCDAWRIWSGGTQNITITETR